MKRLIWLLVLAGVVFALNELRTKGADGAFGGALAGYLDPLESEGELALPEGVLE